METKTPPVTEVAHEDTTSAELAEKTVSLPSVDAELAQRLYQTDLHEAELAERPQSELAELTVKEATHHEQSQTVVKMELPEPEDHVQIGDNTTSGELPKINTDVMEPPSRQQHTEVVDETVEQDTGGDNPINNEISSPQEPANGPEAITESRRLESTARLQAWETVLHEEPPELYNDFARALEIFIATATQTESDAVDAESLPVPPIATTVSERLTELSTEEQAEVALAIQDVIGALHGLQVLEARNADPQAINAVEQQLEELCVTLFEQLKIDYTEQDIKDFVIMLRDPEFRPDRPTTFGVDASDPGTHEAKYFARVVSMATDAESQLHTILGTMVLASLGLRTMAREAA